ncbi:ATP-dependent helicase HrpB [bacterium SCSIO 12696]|nr:ATP-dependent helicase HrpB [bacterium SCSIO 12696]
MGKDSDGWEYEIYDESDPEIEGYEYEYTFPVDGELELTTTVRRIALSTNVAETSITIDGIATVVDSGLAREPQFDPGTGMTRLRTRRISKASSVQRAGRAGRLQAGVCYRLWSEQQQQQLAAHTTPEMLQVDLAPLALQLLAWGVDDPLDLQWLDPPPTGAYQQALALLARFGAAQQASSGSWQLNRRGEQMAQLPTHPRLAAMLLQGAEHGLVLLASQLAALLAEPVPSVFGSDLSDALNALDSHHCPQALKPWCKRVLDQASRFQGLVAATDRNHPDRATALGLLLAFAYPDRIARLRPDGRYQLSNGRLASFRGQTSLLGEPWLVVADLGGHSGNSEDNIYSAVPLQPALFDDVLTTLVDVSEQACWDDREQRFVAEKRWCIGAIVWRTEALAAVDTKHRVAALLQVVRNQGLGILPWSDALKQWRSRVMLLHQILGSPWPDLSDDALLGSLEDWLAPYLEPVNRLSHFQQLDMPSILANLLPWPLPQQLEDLAPQKLAVPSGSMISVDYSQSPPVLAVKLQEMFGCLQTPTVAQGKVALMVHLLSPARRPLQITQDLAGFWSSSYQPIKKEMKGRYPKHPWPDDPSQAIATAKVKKRL